MPIVLPPPPVRRLSPAHAGAIAKRARKLLRRGDLTHRQLALLDCMLWSCRSPATGALVVSYTALQRLARVSRSTIAAELGRLEGLGLLTRIKRRVREAWHQGGTRTRQATSAYILHPPADHSEFADSTVNRELEILYVRQPESRAANGRGNPLELASLIVPDATAQSGSLRYSYNCLPAPTPGAPVGAACPPPPDLPAGTSFSTRISPDFPNGPGQLVEANIGLTFASGQVVGGTIVDDREVNAGPSELEVRGSGLWTGFVAFAGGPAQNITDASWIPITLPVPEPSSSSAILSALFALTAARRRVLK